MTKRAWILMAFLALPIALQAQRGRKFDPLPPKEGEFAPPPMPRAKDMEKGSPAAILLDKKKKLQLSDSQVTVLQMLRRASADSSAATYATWDSVRTDVLIAGKSTLVDPDSAQVRQRRLMAVVQALRARNAWARNQALQVLTEDQKPKAKEYWDDEDKENQKWMRSRGGGGGRPAGQRPRAS
ncbi:MAG: hypothetical protein AABZ29_06385 [Gemmatimonadota bacterium]